jgi:hypothetical protein
MFLYVVSTLTPHKPAGGTLYCYFILFHLFCYPFSNKTVLRNRAIFFDTVPVPVLTSYFLHTVPAPVLAVLDIIL